jgi:hypothetical protein
MNTRATTTEIPSEFTQQQKRDVMESDRKARERPATFKDFASAFANETRGGRYGKSDASALVRPLPPASPWSGAQPGPGDERPLGYDINEVPDLGFSNEQKSVPAPAASPSAVETTERVGPHQPDPTSSEDVGTILGSGSDPTAPEQGGDDLPRLLRRKDDTTDQ